MFTAVQVPGLFGNAENILLFQITLWLCYKKIKFIFIYGISPQTHNYAYGYNSAYLYPTKILHTEFVRIMLQCCI